MSTFIVEMHEEVWRRAGFGRSRARRRPGRERLGGHRDRARSCSPSVLDGHRLIATTRGGSTSRPSAMRALAPRERRAARRRRAHRALLDRLRHQARAWRTRSRSPGRCASTGRRRRPRWRPTRTTRRPIVESTQRAAQASLEWFEGIARYVHQPAEQFAFNLLTRSRRITYGELQLRDPAFVEQVDDWFAGEVARQAGLRTAAPRPPMFTPFRLRELELRQPRRRLADGHVLRASTARPATSTSSTSARAAIGGAGLVMTRDDLRLAARGGSRPAAAGLYATSTGRGVAADRRLRARARRREDRRASSATRAARARRSCCGRARTSRSPTATGR